jgi:ketosteroid isomerase-like protein
LILTCAVCAAHAQSAPSVPSARAQELAALVREVTTVERSFAKSMADRDLDAFSSLVAEDAVFRDGTALLLGRAAVVESWRARFKPGPAPFSWDPDTVTVSDAGTTALSSGPVFDPKGRMVARFTSVWRREPSPDGRVQWRIIVDQGVPLSECKPAAQ